VYLTREEEKMHSGERGPAREWAMNYLVAYGEALDAESFVEISSVGCGGIYIDTLKGVPRDVYRDIVKRRMAVPVYSWCIPDPEQWQEGGFTPEAVEKHRELNELSGKLGIHVTGTCANYLVGWIPIFGSHVASDESSQVPYINSVLGARSNRETLESLLRIGIAGRTPFCGLHTDEERQGNLLVRVDAELRDASAYAALGDYVGRIRQESLGVSGDIPVFTGIKGDVRPEYLVGFGASLATTGNVGLYHLVGVTPEARTLSEAFQGEKPPEAVTVGEAEMKEAFTQISTQGPDEIDWVVLGCPHYTVDQLYQLSKRLEGKKIKKGITFWVLTSPAHREMSKLTGILNTIKGSGASVLSQCWSILDGLHPEGYVVAATDSPKFAYYAPKIWRATHPGTHVDVWFGGMEDCVSAALTGKWREAT